MNWIGRHAELLLAGLLTLILAFAQFRAGPAAVPPAPPAAVVAAPEPAPPVVKAKRKARRKLVAAVAAVPVAPAKARGSRLRAKGEALGGTTPDRVDKTTDTRSAP